MLDQNYSDLKCIFIDGDSNDNSLDIIRKYDQYLSYWVNEPDRGQLHVFNKGSACVSGKIFSWLNTDDQLEPDSLTVVANTCIKSSEAGAFVGHGHHVDMVRNTVYYKCQLA